MTCLSWFFLGSFTLTNCHLLGDVLAAAGVAATPSALLVDGITDGSDKIKRVWERAHKFQKFQEMECAASKIISSGWLKQDDYPVDVLYGGAHQ